MSAGRYSLTVESAQQIHRRRIDKSPARERRTFKVEVLKRNCQTLKTEKTVGTDFSVITGSSGFLNDFFSLYEQKKVGTVV